MKIIHRILLYLALLGSIASWITPQQFAAASAGKPAPSVPSQGYRKLQDITVFAKDLPGTWSGGDGLEAPNNVIPVDTAETYDSLPSVRINVTTQTPAWWNVILSGQSWVTYSIEHYYANGALEFNVKGALGDEKFRIKVQDNVFGRKPENIDQLTKSSDFINVTTEWQKVRIPLKKLIPEGTGFNLRQMWNIVFVQDDDFRKPIKIWINNVRFTSPDNEPGYPAIKVNQLGYPSQAEKYALVTGFQEDLKVDEGTAFEIKRVIDNTSVYSGKLSLVTPYDPYVSGEKMLKADFSAFQQPGTYVMLIQGLDPSPKFQIGDDLYQPLLTDALRYFYLQRQGIALPEKYAGKFARGIGHPGDSNVVFLSALQNKPNAPPQKVDVSQGWYDAGDYGKYVPFAAGPVVDLLSAYDLYPGLFTDGQMNIPESGNGKPDLLDEVKWELDWMLKMQDPETGGFYQLIYPNNCPDGNPRPSCSPDAVTNAVAQRYIADLVNGVPNVKPTDATAKATAALAAAARIYQHVDPAYADQLLKAAQAGWSYLLAHPNNIPATGWNGEEKTDDQQRMWTAAELFRTTGGDEFNRYFLAHYQEYEKIWTATQENAGDVVMQAFLAYNASPNADTNEKSWFTKYFTSWSEGQYTRAENNPWRNFLLDGSDGNNSDYYWGSNAVTLQTIVVLARGSRITGAKDSRLTNAANAQMNYILGVNPLRHSYVSGYGEDSVQSIYSFIYSYDGVPELPRGYLAEGPNMYNGGLVYSRFAGKAYTDTNSDWAVSEHAIYYNARLVFVTALVDAETCGANCTTTAALPAERTATVAPATPTPTLTLAAATPTPPALPSATNAVTPSPAAPQVDKANQPGFLQGVITGMLITALTGFILYFVLIRRSRVQ